jgi:hypothetical protein
MNVTAHTTLAGARRTLREFAALTEREDPEALADLVEDIPATLHAAACVNFWLRRYVEALRRRRPH